MYLVHRNLTSFIALWISLILKNQVVGITFKKTYVVSIPSELYFDMETKQLEAIWNDSSTQWNFDFNHRNEIQSNMNDAFNAQADLLFKLQEEECKEMLAEAEASVAHMTEVVDKYQAQVKI